MLRFAVLISDLAGEQAMSIQYHPEASPGPHDSDVCFDQFIAMLEAEKDSSSSMDGNSDTSAELEKETVEKPPMIAI